MDDPSVEHVDVLVVGAGISGIAAAHHLRERCPDHSWLIVEARERIGGTWDLFRYPGVRSDSDMHTLGFRFRPWTEREAIADGPAIRAYVEEAARAEGIDERIRFGHRVVGADWSTADARWTVTVEVGEDRQRRRITCGFLWLCAGYYDHDRGHLPSWEGTEDFTGVLVHPQFWPEDLDHAGQRVVVVGSGATAVTIVPAMAEQAAHVTMLQRSPTYVLARPREDAVAIRLQRYLPDRVAHRLVRWRNILLNQLLYALSRRRPAMVRELITDQARAHLGPDVDVGTHFTPTYDPWDERLCLAPDADLFASIREGRASVVTAVIDRFVPEGIRLEDGHTLEADIVVTATGLELRLLGDVELRIDGQRVDPARSVVHRGMMFSDIPNLATTVGYVNASWTLRAELTAIQVCRLLRTMRRRGMRQATPRLEGEIEPTPFMRLSSGYVRRAADRLPVQGDAAPWHMPLSYARDWLSLRLGAVDDQIELSNPTVASVGTLAHDVAGPLTLGVQRQGRPTRADNASRIRRLDEAYRRTGANLPLGDARPSHGAEMEGWFWRVTDVMAGRVLVVLCGVNRHPDGDWATVAVAAEPGGLVRSAALSHASAARDRFEVAAGDGAFRATATDLHLDLGPDARVDLSLHRPVEWPHMLGGGGVFSAVPFLGQYWHPHLLGGGASGRSTVGDQVWDLHDAEVYAEKNWGAGFPEHWWWGQAHGFDRSDVCVAFSGGVLTAGPFAATVGGVVVRVGGDVLRLTPPLARVRSRTDGRRWEVDARGRGQRVRIVGVGSGDPHVLPVPLPAERRNVETDFEFLAGHLSLELSGRVTYRGETDLAGLEIGHRPDAAAEHRRRP